MKASVLIIEQHRQHAEGIYRDVHELFDHYHIATTAQAAMTYIDDHDFDMIIINPFFADGSGRAFIRNLKDIPKLNITPIIVVSELPASRVKLDFYSIGADVYLEMPYETGAFFERIKEELLRHFQIKANHGRDKDSAFISREEFEQSYIDAQRDIRDNNKKGIISLIAPAGMYYIIKDFGLETGIKLITSLSKMMQKMCSEELKATIWAQKTIVFMIMGHSEDQVAESLEKIRKQYIERFSDIAKIRETPGIRAVLSLIPIESNLHETINKLSNQLFQLSKMTNVQPIQFYGNTVSMKRRIMIADPDPVAYNVLAHRLKKDGYIPTPFNDKTDLINHPEFNDIGAILIDSMVSAGGIDMVRELHQDGMLSDKPIMFLSRYGLEEEIAEAFNAGAEDYLLKPISMVELSARMKRLIE